VQRPAPGTLAQNRISPPIQPDILEVITAGLNGPDTDTRSVQANVEQHLTQYRDLASLRRQP